MSSKEKHHRNIIPNFIPISLCKELEFIQKSNCTVGYRPNVFSTTLSHLIATNCSPLLMPFIPLREKVKEKVEELFGCEYELFVEFTGLISWTKGASIGWHSDDNRPYLKQRDFTAVCYLNSYGENFKGGIFHFQDGEPKNYFPMAGDLVLYSADSRNIHCVDEITDGERLTLTLWFSRNNLYDEDVKLLSLLSQNISNDVLAASIPLPASSNMYWLSPYSDSDQKQGFDIHFAELFFMGYDILPTDAKSYSEMNMSTDFSDIFTKPLKLTRGDKLFSKQFDNILHASQVVQFYCWKQSISQLSEGVLSDIDDVILLSRDQKDNVCKLKFHLSGSMQLDETSFCHSPSSKRGELHFDWGSFSDAVKSWEEYMFKLQEQLLLHFPHWRDYRSLFSVSLRADEE